ncbi:MAG: hypothetical protein AAGE52_34450 [Myxococcota bacterium]
MRGELLAAVLLLVGCRLDLDQCRVPGACASRDAAADAPADAASADAGVDAAEDCRGADDGDECSAGAGRCLDERCCTGCVDGGNCIEPAATTDDSCGVGGQACAPCVAPLGSCQAGICRATTPLSRISVGGRSACAVAEDGALYCWGQNFDTGSPGAAVCPACLGADPDPACLERVSGCGCERGVKTPPRRIVEGPFADVQLASASIEGGAALGRDGRLHFWGDNGRFVLSPLTPDSEATVCLPEAAAEPRRYENLGFGFNAACAVDTTSALYCWGNSQPALGGNRRTEATLIVVPEAPERVAASGGHVCFVSVRGDLYCRGSNASGQVAPDCGDECAVWQRIGARWVEVDVGSGFTCGLREEGTRTGLYCWGGGPEGQLGLGEVRSLPAPTEELDAERDWGFLDVGREHACALTVDGEAFCWGNNDRAQCGALDPDAVDRPNAITQPEPFVAIAAGNRVSCAIGRSGLAYCWGTNEFEQLGPDRSLSPAPLPIVLED